MADESYTRGDSTHPSSARRRRRRRLSGRRGPQPPSTSPRQDCSHVAIYGCRNGGASRWRTSNSFAAFRQQASRGCLLAEASVQTPVRGGPQRLDGRTQSASSRDASRPTSGVARLRPSPQGHPDQRPERFAVIRFSEETEAESHATERPLIPLERATSAWRPAHQNPCLGRSTSTQRPLEAAPSPGRGRSP